MYCRGRPCPRQAKITREEGTTSPEAIPSRIDFGFPSFVLEHFFLLGVGLGLDIKWAGSFGPTIAPQNPAVRLLGRGGGF